MPMFKGFTERLYEGERDGDFRLEDLPPTRVALFLDVLKVRWSKMVVVSLEITAFCLPLILWIFYYLTLLFTSLSEMPLEEQRAIVDWYMMVFLAVCIPLIMIASLGITGGTLVLRNWSRDEHAWMASDFFAGIKANWKQALGVGFLDGSVILLGYSAITFYGNQAAETPAMMMLQMVAVVVLVLLAMMNILVYPLMVTYKLSFIQLVKNALLLSVVRLPQSVLVLLACLLPVAIALVFSDTMIIVLLIVFVFGFALYGLLSASYAHMLFDKYINPHIPGARVRRGLAPILNDDFYDDDEDDDDDED